MKFMLMMHAPRGTGEYQIEGWTKQDLQAHMEFMDQLNRDLTNSGEWADGQGLAAPGEARIVRAGKNGAPIVTDGPYPEAKEFLAGYWIVSVDCAERAHEIAARASTAPGPGGEPLNMPIEVRQVMSAPTVDAW